jgi:hypothetical protein
MGLPDQARAAEKRGAPALAIHAEREAVKKLKIDYFRP